MPQAATKTGVPDEFELFDAPGRERIAGIATTILGAAFVALVWWEYPQERAEQLWALFAAFVGVCAVAGGATLYWLSMRQPYLILRADRSGLRVVERFRFHREPVYILLPWEQIRDFRLRSMGEAGYAMEVQAGLPAGEEERIRSHLKFPSPPGLLLFEVPLVWLPMSDAWIEDILRSIAARGRETRPQG
jgi:hypothetical protein